MVFNKFRTFLKNNFDTFFKKCSFCSQLLSVTRNGRESQCGADSRVDRDQKAFLAVTFCSSSSTLFKTSVIALAVIYSDLDSLRLEKKIYRIFWLEFLGSFDALFAATILQYPARDERRLASCNPKVR